ncbi:helix-turn-helix domain-containing protein [Embleya scabrispora]|uniref:helix-turn-helix domain-containing protein n=1 Tax=Embleya scabrispora TaxID=159449 RepID=UPI00036F32FF|nr:helix-turn-helix domain-containing protein [Embleya scabrispora]MYS85025.1 helix-turn-helix transcriptional regulator [Streptomyces sp. SID5474]
MRDEDLPKHLGRLGLADREALVYRAMLGTGPTGTANLAARLGLDLEDVDKSVARLVELGLASAAGPAPAAVTPIEPSIGIERLAHVRSAELRQAQLAAIDAYRGYRRSVHPQASTDEMIEVLTGSQIKERIRLAEDTATTEVLRFDSPPYHTGGVSNEAEERNLEHGVAYRIVYSKSAVQNAHYYACNIKPCIAAGEQARVLPTVPVKLTIFDRRLALVSMSFVEADINDSLLIVRSSSLLTALIGLFESSWRAAFPLYLGGRVPPALRPIHRRILELLGSGLTDEAIAELLGISRRTLSRNLEHLNRSAGSTTRFQLALHAARKGWI